LTITTTFSPLGVRNAKALNLLSELVGCKPMSTAFEPTGIYLEK
jgi:hypothetical protein